MTPKGGLGRGLGALIPGDFESEEKHNGIRMIPIDKIIANPSQPRTTIDNSDLEELSASIREHGILQPVIVTQSSASDSFTLIAGERRLRAAKAIGLGSVPAIVRDANEQQRLEFALIENLQREDLTPLEAAQAFQKLCEEFNLSHEDVALRVGKSRSAVTNTLRLLNLTNTGKIALSEGKISEGHARAILSLAQPQMQNSALATVLQMQLNVRQTEELVRKLSGQRTMSSQQKPEKSELVKEIEQRLRDRFGTKINLNAGKKGGALVFHYYSDEELDTLLGLLLD